MIKPAITTFDKGRKIMFGPARLSYPHLFETDQLTGKYSASFIIPAKEQATLDAIRRCISETTGIGVTSVWNGKRPAELTSPLSEMENPPEGMGECYVLRASSKEKPVITGADKARITDPGLIYGGCWVLASVGFAPYKFGGKNGVTCYINALRKTSDGARFGGDDSADLNGVDVSGYVEETFDDSDL